MKIPQNLRWKPTGKTLGQGGQGTVVQVTDASGEFPGTFALKALTAGKPAKAYERFAREVETIRTINHPSIVRIIDHSAQDAQFQFYVMEFHDRATALKKLLGTTDNPYHENPLRGISLFMQIASAVAACESHGVVHRDLSPANILVLPDDTVKLIDFGLCQIADAETITLSDEGVGTPNYMAPECESGSPGPVKSAADLYSAGKILWSAVANQNAFAREAPVFGAKSFDKLFPESPPTWHLHHLFAKTIRHDQSARYKTAAEALTNAKHVHFLIAAGYPPLELLNERCPLCGVGKLADFEQSYMVFGNPNPAGYSSLQCNYCGFCFARNSAKIRKAIEDRQRLT